MDIKSWMDTLKQNNKYWTPEDIRKMDDYYEEMHMCERVIFDISAQLEKEGELE